MIQISDATLLVSTKLRAHKIRTIITVLIASILFGVLVAASLVMTGAFQSVNSFREDGLTSRYIVSVVNAPGDPLALQKLLRDPDLIAESKKRYEKQIDEKIAEAERLNIYYNHASDPPPYTLSANGEEWLSINDRSGIVHDILEEKFSNELAFDDVKLETIAKRYHAIDIFTEEFFAIPAGSSLVVLDDGKETFYDQSDEAEVNEEYTSPLLDSSRIAISPSNITAPFMLQGNAGWEPSSKTIPIILPQNNVEQLLGMEKLPATASPGQKLDRLMAVRDQAKKLTFQTCYRNEVSQLEIQKTLQQEKEVKANEDKEGYQKPTLLYSLPDPTKCENPNIIRDVRTSDEKIQDEKQMLFDQKFGKITKPISYLVSFKVVGISPAETSLQTSNEQTRSANDAINDLLKTAGIGQAIPRALYDQIPDKTKYSDVFNYSPLYLFGNEDNKQRFVEFASAKDATKFIDEQSCTAQYDNTCKPLGRPYQASLAFSNSAAIDDIQNLASRWLNYAMISVIILATAIMWLTIGRTIADGRRETAVFRAIGFKRIDIAMIYALYAMALSVLVVLFAAGIGLSLAHIANHQFAPELTARAQNGFGGLDMSKEVSLVGVDQQQLLIILVACLTTGILSVIMPILLNIRRSPIRDMREE